MTVPDRSDLLHLVAPIRPHIISSGLQSLPNLSLPDLDREKKVGITRTERKLTPLHGSHYALPWRRTLECGSAMRGVFKARARCASSEQYSAVNLRHSRQLGPFHLVQISRSCFFITNYSHGILLTCPLRLISVYLIYVL